MPRIGGLSKPARLLLVATSFLLVCGLVMVYSASSVTDYVRYGDSAYHLKRQALFAGIGLIGLVVVSFWDFRGRRGRQPILSPRVLAYGLWALTLIALIAVAVVGVSGGGATMSLHLGPVFIQPSEYAKLGCLLAIAVLLVEWNQGQLTTSHFLQRLVVIAAPVLLLIMAQPDMGSAAVLVLAIGMLLWLGGFDGRWLALGAATGIVAGAVLIATSEYRMERVTSFLNPWADPADTGYQLIQSLYALGSGGLFGVGLGLSKQKYFYLPLAHNDFIFSVIGEEFGLIGTLAVVAAFALFGYAGIRIALESHDLFGRLLAGSLTAMIVTQALINMAAATGLMPITGVTLPFISSGGTSLTLSLVCVGLLLAVSRYGGTAKIHLVRPRDRQRPETDSETRGSHHSASTLERRRNSRSHLSGVDGGRASSQQRA